jgi:hypothetical protein
MLVNKLCGLAQHLPEHVTNWIGQQLSNLGEGQDAYDARKGMTGSTNVVTAMGSQGQGVMRQKPDSGGGGGGGGRGKGNTSSSVKNTISGGDNDISRHA